MCTYAADCYGDNCISHIQNCLHNRYGNNIVQQKACLKNTMHWYN